MAKVGGAASEDTVAGSCCVCGGCGGGGNCVVDCARVDVDGCDDVVDDGLEFCETKF